MKMNSSSFLNNQVNSMLFRVFCTWFILFLWFQCSVLNAEWILFILCNGLILERQLFHRKQCYKWWTNSEEVHKDRMLYSIENTGFRRPPVWKFAITSQSPLISKKGNKTYMFFYTFESNTGENVGENYKYLTFMYLYTWTLLWP